MHGYNKKAKLLSSYNKSSVVDARSQKITLPPVGKGAIG